MFYRAAGSGPAVVLVHGFPEDGTIWKNQFDLFPNHQLIVPDLPGSGRSEAIDDMSMEGMAEAVKALIGSRKAILIGHSMGGYIALAFAERHPLLVNGLGLFHSTAFADGEERKEKRRQAIATVKANGIEAFLKTFVPNLYSSITKEKTPALIDEHLASVHNFSAEALVKYFEAMMQRPDRTAVLRESEVPVLFVMGKEDKAVPVEDSLKQVYLPQRSHVHLLLHTAHEGMVEEAAEANKILTQFVNAVDSIA